MHFADGAEPVVKELQSLVAGDDVEGMVLGDRQARRVTFAPVDLGRHAARDAQHARAGIDGGDASARANDRLRQPRDDARSARDVEKPVARAQARAS